MGERHHGHEAEEGELAARAHDGQDLGDLKRVVVERRVLQKQVVHDDAHNAAGGTGDEAGYADAEDVENNPEIGNKITPLQNHCSSLAQEVIDTHESR